MTRPRIRLRVLRIHSVLGYDRVVEVIDSSDGLDRECVVTLLGMIEMEAVGVRLSALRQRIGEVVTEVVERRSDPGEVGVEAAPDTFGRLSRAAGVVV